VAREREGQINQQRVIPEWLMEFNWLSPGSCKTGMDGTSPLAVDDFFDALFLFAS